MHSGPIALVRMALRFARPWQQILILAAVAGGGLLLLALGRPLAGAVPLAFAVLGGASAGHGGMRRPAREVATAPDDGRGGQECQAGGSAGRDVIRRPARQAAEAPGDAEAQQGGQAGGTGHPEGGG